MPFIFILCLLIPGELLASNSPAVVVSIRPLQIISNQIMAGAGRASLLIDNSQSPHHFQLKPSQMRRASKADLLIWISDDFETGLRRLQSVLPAHTERLQLVRHLSAEQLIDEHQAIDGHLWLSPENVIAIAHLIELKLSLIDPANRTLYQQNTQQLISSLMDWKQRNGSKLQQLKPRYILDHQFFSHFENSFNLHNSGSLRDSHDSHSSIKQLTRLHQTLQQSPVKFLLVTSLPLSPQAQQISQQYQLRVERINTLGKTTENASITDFFNDIVNSLSHCQIE
jgi:zinc transport system substrate-binding protein